MKMLSWFRNKDATNAEILLIIFVVIICMMLLFYPSDRRINVDPNLESMVEGGLRNNTIKTRCYHIPYTLEQLKEILINGGDERKELNRILLEETQDEDLEEIIAPPRIIYDEYSGRICLDFMDKLDPDPAPFTTRLI